MSAEKQSESRRGSNAPNRRELLALVQPWKQEHLLAFWDELSPPQQEQLAEQIRSVDFAQINELYREASAAHRHSDPKGGAETTDDESPAAIARRAEPPPAIRLTEANPRYSI